MLDAFWALAHHITMAPLTSPGDSSQQEVGNSEQHQEPNTDWTAEQLVHASYKDLGSPAQVEERFLRHLLLSPTCRHSLEVLLTESSTTTRDYSITVDAFDLLEGDPILGHLLLRYPATLLPLLENAVVGAQGALARELQERADAHNAGMNEESQSQSQSQSQLPLPDGSHNPPERTPIIMSLLPPMMVKGCCRQSSDGNGNGSAATRVHARLVHLPPTCCKTSLGSLQAEDVGKVFQISGTVVRAGPVQMYESARTYKCTTGGGGGGGGGGAKAKQKSGGCGRTFVAHADMEQRNNALVPPDRCPLLVPDGNERCPGSKLEAVEGGSVHTDYQEIKIQEAASSLAIGHIPRSLLIKLQHDLVDHCQPGDEVVVVGSLLAQWHQQTVLPDVDCQIGMAMSAHSVRVIQEKGSSAWKNTAGANSVGEQDNLRKEFDAYWSEERNQLYPMLARDFICKSVCPKLYGMKIIKLALLITLIGGVSSDAYQDKNESKDKSLPRNHADYSDDDDDDEPEPFQAVLDDKSKQTQVAAYYGDENTRRSSKQKGYKDDAVKTRRRDQSHLLLVGDPGTGKSQVLRFAAALCPRSVLTTGVGTTSAGLTCAAVREGNGNEFSLEAGALVLADKGVCCIDEFGCIREQDRTTIHEAMEQQTLSVAKAGIVCKLNCRATIIAVMNPKDCLYDNQASLSHNTGLGTPLLSRFDIIFKLMDTSDAERDSNVTTYLLNRAIQGAGFDVSTLDGEKASESPWTMEKLRSYISFVKELQPVMSDSAALLLERHYEKCRSSPGNTIPVTVRFLESLIRLSQAHARLLYRKNVTLQDAVAILQVMECTAYAYGGFDGSVDDFENAMYCDPMTVDFSPEADLDMLCFEYRILERYGMLSFIDDDRRRKAMAALGTTASGNGADSSGWHGAEDPRDRQWQGGPSGVGDASNGQSWSGVPQSGGVSEWLAPGPAPGPSPSVTQDHYGRYHFSTPGSQSQNKRPRR